MSVQFSRSLIEVTNGEGLSKKKKTGRQSFLMRFNNFQSQNQVMMLEKNNELSCWKTAFQTPVRGEDYTILQALFSIDMWLILLASNVWPRGNFNGNRQLGSDWSFLTISKEKHKHFCVTCEHLDLPRTCGLRSCLRNFN